jgi:CDGSH-type Zn-finger protein
MTGSRPHGPPDVPADPRSCVTIRCREHGPLVVELPADDSVRLRVTDHVGQEFPLPTQKRAVALCRCGHTASQPFCDGSHTRCEFSGAELAPRPPQ